MIVWLNIWVAVKIHARPFALAINLNFRPKFSEIFKKGIWDQYEICRNSCIKISPGFKFPIFFSTFVKNTKMSSTKKLKLEELGRIDVETFKQTEKISLVVVLDNIRSMHNVGAVFRTADAFLVEKIILCGITPQPPHREIHKAALGATESVTWSYEKNISAALEDLKKENFKIIGIEQTTHSELITEFNIDKKGKYALVLGNEVDGLSDEALPLYDTFLEIPQLGTKHSLNVSVCAGIVMWEFFKDLK